MRDKARDALALEPGCQHLDVSHDLHNPASNMLDELYDDAVAFEEHKAMPHYLSFNATTDNMITGKTVRQWQRIRLRMQLVVVSNHSPLLHI